MEGVAGEVFSRGETGIFLPKPVEQNFLLLFQITGRGSLSRKGEEKLFHKPRDRGVAVGGGDAGLAVGIVIKGNGDILHGFTVSDIHCFTS